jgi:hypothetical protein
MKSTKWCPQVVPTSGAHKWCPQVVPTSGAHKWCPQVVPTSGAHKWCPQVGMAKENDSLSLGLQMHGEKMFGASTC